MFITFEGIDGSGKSTQIALLRNKLLEEGHKVTVFREPGGTEVSEKIRALLLNPDFDIHPVTELLLFSSARAQLISEKVRPLLNKNEVVILDRFYDSTTAYQGYGRSSLPLQDIHRLNKIASHNIVPDITFYLKISLEE
ncbi:MAG: dTMP kinase, partial [Balneolaceae bacterium]|nr:dTMP kinase [Balneolaceae bacterium]